MIDYAQLQRRKPRHGASHPPLRKQVPREIPVLGSFDAHQVNVCLVDQGSRLEEPSSDFRVIREQTATFVPERGAYTDQRQNVREGSVREHEAGHHATSHSISGRSL
jgi:hypothetical protein